MDVRVIIVRSYVRRVQIIVPKDAYRKIQSSPVVLKAEFEAHM